MPRNDRKPGGLPCGAERVDAEHQHRHLQDRENARLDHGHGMQQCADRRRRHHRGRQPEMQRHHRRLADAEHVEKEQSGNDRRADIGRENAAGPEIERSGENPGGDDRRQKQQEGRAEQKHEINAAGANGFFVPFVGDQWIGRERQRLVEQKQREQILGERDPDRAAERHGETDVESRLARLVVGAHVADRVDRIDDPQ